MVKVGDKAPDFSLKDTDGNTVRLSDIKNRNIVLYFYPKDDTPGCTAEACSFRDLFLEYKKKGIVVIGISKDDEKSHKKFIEKYKLPFTLLCDVDKKVNMLYGVWGKKKLYGREYYGTVRTTFLIDKKGRIKAIIDKVKCEAHAQDIIKMFEDL